MLKQFFIVSSFIICFIVNVSLYAAQVSGDTGKKPIIITSETLIADNKNSTAVFEGSVAASTDDMKMYADKMTVFYDNSDSKVNKIVAVGNVKVLNKARVLFSDEAIYLDNEEQIIFSGNPKVVEENNVITGKKIIFFLKDERAVVEGSRVILQNKQVQQ